MQVLNIIYVVLLSIVTAYTIYSFIFVLVGLLPRKQKYSIVEDKEKFCIFVPCHNEGDVVKETVFNLAKLDYDPKLFNIYFIADNCTDNTAECIEKAIKESKKENFSLFVRNESDKMKRGKPHALRWAMDKLEEQDKFYNYYTMFLIFDADNFADEDFLKHINSHYNSFSDKKKPAIIQAYLDSKNKDTLISRGYYVSYRCVNGFWQLSKTRLGLNCAVGGTGFAMTIKFLNEIGGYNCISLTEDLEIQTIATLKNKRVIYNGNVRVYDEKPTELKQSAVQKTRWLQGHWFVNFKYSFKLFISMFNPKNFKSIFRKIDNILYLGVPVITILSLVVIGIQFGCSLAGVALFFSPILNIVMSIISIFVLFVSIPIASLYDGNKNEKKKILKELLPNLIAFYFSAIVFIYAVFVGLFKCGNQTVWKKTKHKVTTLDQNTGREKATSEEIVEKVSNETEANEIKEEIEILIEEANEEKEEKNII